VVLGGIGEDPVYIGEFAGGVDLGDEICGGRMGRSARVREKRLVGRGERCTSPPIGIVS